MQTGRETYIAVVCIGSAVRTRLSVINIINWGVWLVSNFIIIIFFNFLKCSEIGSNLFFFINRGGTSVSLTDLYVFCFYLQYRSESAKTAMWSLFICISVDVRNCAHDSELF